MTFQPLAIRPCFGFAPRAYRACLGGAGWLESGRCTDMQKFNRESAFLETILE